MIISLDYDSKINLIYAFRFLYIGFTFYLSNRIFPFYPAFSYDYGAKYEFSTSLLLYYGFYPLG